MSYGQGPGDIARLYDISFDKENNELVAYMHSFLMFFTASGEFIRKERLPFGFYNFTVIPDGYVIKKREGTGDRHLQDLDDYTLYVTDRKFKLKSAGMYVKPHKINYSGRNYIYSNNNTVHITQKFTDTIYKYIHETNQLKAQYALDYRKKMPKRYLEGSYDEFEYAVRQNDYYFYIGEYMESVTHHAFYFDNWYKGAAIVFRNKKSGNMAGGTGMRYSIVPHVLSIFPVSSIGDYFVTYHLPNISDTIFSYMLPYCTGISDEDKVILKNLTEDDNPVLVLFKLNDF
jgi:hypothetical protein